MTMHMIQGVNTANTKKRKPKMTKSNLERWAREMQVYNKDARRRGDQTLTLDQYIDYLHGYGLPKAQKSVASEPYMAQKSAAYRETPVYKSNLDMGSGVCAAPQKKQYTGTLVKGIGTMHKSNAIPIIDEEQMKDLARMRR